MKVCVIAAENAETGRLDWPLPGIDLPCAALGQSWAGVRLQPVSLRIVVESEGERAEEPSFRQRGHLLPIVPDRGNFWVGNLETLCGCGFIARKTADSLETLRFVSARSKLSSANGIGGNSDRPRPNRLADPRWIAEK